MKLHTLLFFLAGLFIPNLVAHSDTAIVMNDDLRAVCNLIKDTWENIGYTQTDEAFVKSVTGNDDTMPSDILLNALHETDNILHELFINPQEPEIRDFQALIAQLINQVKAQLPADQALTPDEQPETTRLVPEIEAEIAQPVAITEEEKEDDARAIVNMQQIGTLLVNNQLTVAGNTHLIEDMTFNGNIFSINPKGMCFNATKNMLGVGTQNPKSTLDIRGNANVNTNLSVGKIANIGGSVTVGNSLTVSNAATIGGPATISNLGTGVVHASNGLLSAGLIEIADMDDNSVSSFALIDRCVTNDKLATQSVTADKLHNPLDGDINLTGNLVFNQTNTSLNAVGAPAESLLNIVRGTIASDGTILSGAGFTANQTSTGVYAITFANAFGGTNTYQMMVTPSVGIDRRINVTNTSSTVATVSTFNDAATPTAQQFNFLAIGV